MRKNGSLKKIIERETIPKLEQAWVKYPREEPVVVSQNRKEKTVGMNWPAVRKIWKKQEKKPYTHMHTHPYREDGDAAPDKYLQILPSKKDMLNLFLDRTQKTMVISQQDAKSGEVYGYLVVRKTEKSPKSKYSFVESESLFHRIMRKIGKENDEVKVDMELYNDINYMGSRISSARLDHSKEGSKKARMAWNEFAQKYHLQYRFVPMKGHEEIYAAAKKSKHSRLEDTIGTLGIIILSTSLIFMGGSITGNVVLSKNFPIFLNVGWGLFLLGLLAIIIRIKILKNKRVKLLKGQRLFK